IVGRDRAARRKQPSRGAIEVRPAHGRAALDDREPVGGEDQRGALASELLGRTETGAVDLGTLPFASAERDVDPHVRAAACAGETDPGSLLPEADQLRVGPRARREALGADVKRLEQVRLAGAVRADGQDETRTQRQLEARVRAEVRERDRGDDQPASRIGMIRYQKSSAGPWISPGRSGSISRSRSSSPDADSIPSRRKSALNPISSGSPSKRSGRDSRAS